MREILEKGEMCAPPPRLPPWLLVICLFWAKWLLTHTSVGEGLCPLGDLTRGSQRSGLDQDRDQNPRTGHLGGNLKLRDRGREDKGSRCRDMEGADLHVEQPGPGRVHREPPQDRLLSLYVLYCSRLTFFPNLRTIFSAFMWSRKFGWCFLLR